MGFVEIGDGGDSHGDWRAGTVIGALSDTSMICTNVTYVIGMDTLKTMELTAGLEPATC
jgi:hypothetical protein